jgi:septum formation inhibitor MinC
MPQHTAKEIQNWISILQSNKGSAALQAVLAGYVPEGEKPGFDTLPESEYDNFMAHAQRLLGPTHDTTTVTITFQSIGGTVAKLLSVIGSVQNVDPAVIGLAQQIEKQMADQKKATKTAIHSGTVSSGTGTITNAGTVSSGGTVVAGGTIASPATAPPTSGATA